MNILSLTGGGYKGVFTLAILKELERFKSDNNLDTCIDIYAGTSVGSIIAAGLAFGKTVEEIDELFQENAEKIFSGKKRGPGWFKSRYENNGLRQVLEKIFEDKKIGQSLKPLIISSLDIETSTPVVMSSFPNTFGYSGLHYEEMPVVDAVLASCAAPTYFPIVKPDFPQEPEYYDDVAGYRTALTSGKQSWMGDGGLVANAPDLIAASEALTTYGVPFSKIQILSVGTTQTKFEVKSGKRGDKNRLLRWGLLHWFVSQKKGFLIEVIMNAQVKLAERLLTKILNSENYIRLDHRSAIGEGFDLDDITKRNDLVGVAEATVYKYLNDDAYDPHRLQIFLDRKSSTAQWY